MSSSSVVQQAVVPLHQSSSLLQALPGISYRNLQPRDFDDVKVTTLRLHTAARDACQQLLVETVGPGGSVHRAAVTLHLFC